MSPSFCTVIPDSFDMRDSLQGDRPVRFQFTAPVNKQCIHSSKPTPHREKATKIATDFNDFREKNDFSEDTDSFSRYGQYRVFS